jgi:hypothetical protein
MTNGQLDNRFPSGRLRGEPLNAFRAYCVYRDLGPDRSLSAAWDAHCAAAQSKKKSRGRPRIGARATACSGQWTTWSRQFQWAERAPAWDDSRYSEQRESELVKVAKLQEERRNLEWERQHGLERRVRKLYARIDTAIAAPVTEMIITTKIGRQKTIRSTGPRLRLMALASLAKATNETVRAARVGMRPEPASVAPMPRAFVCVDRLAGESVRAYRAFLIYCELGPQRSLDAGWQKHLSDRQRPSSGARCPGRWSVWSREFAWVERAAKYDAWMRAAEFRQLSELEGWHLDFEIANQPLLEGLIGKLDGVLDRAADAPVCSWKKWTNDKGVRVTTEYNTVSASGYAALENATNATARMACGVWGKPTKRQCVPETELE